MTHASKHPELLLLLPYHIYCVCLCVCVIAIHPSRPVNVCNVVREWACKSKLDSGQAVNYCKVRAMSVCLCTVCCKQHWKFHYSSSVYHISITPKRCPASLKGELIIILTPKTSYCLYVLPLEWSHAGGFLPVVPLDESIKPHYGRVIHIYFLLPAGRCVGVCGALCGRYGACVSEEVGFRLCCCVLSHTGLILHR